MRSDQFTNIAQYLCSEMGLGLIRTRLAHDNLVPFRSNLKKTKNRGQDVALYNRAALQLQINNTSKHAYLLNINKVVKPGNTIKI